MFNFGASTSTPSAQPPTAGQTSTPTFSFTGATPSVAPAAPFNLGAASTSTGQQSQQQQQQQPASGGGLFGQAPAAPPAAPAPGASGSLFGGGGGGGGLFGAKPAAAPAAPNGGLFGGASTSMAPSGGGSLFGQTASTSQPAQSGGLFGGQSTFTPAAGGLFGAQSTSTPAAGGLFGSQATAPKPSGGLFGQSTGGLQAPTSQSGLGQSTNTQQPGGLSKNTKFSELPEAHQKIVEQMDSWIKQQKEPAGKINTEPLGKVIWKTSGEVKAASEEYAALAQGLTSLQTSLVALRDKFVAEEEDVRRIAEIWETFKAADGRPGAVRASSHRDFPHEFFARMASAMEERVQRYKKTLVQLNRAVVALASDQEAPSPQAIAQTINNHQNALLNLAAQLENLQLRMNDLRGLFARDFQERTNSMRDPFDIAREEKGMAPVSA